MEKKKEKKDQNPKINQIKDELSSKILRFLSYKPRTSSECWEAATRYLSSYDLKSEEKNRIIEKVLSPLKEGGYIDDEDYARSYILEQQRRRYPRGPYYISKFLYRKGLSQQLIRYSLKVNYSREKQEKFIKELINKKRQKSKDQLSRYLLNRGFSKDLVYRIIDSNSKNH